MGLEDQASVELARSVLPRALYQALVHVFAQGIDGCMLVGGTALAGYYAGHRRSDDLDLFTRDATALRAATLAVDSLRELGASLVVSQRTAQFFAATATLADHVFTVQVVLDPNLFIVGSARRAEDQVVVAQLDTLLKQKAATLVSRASEKDIYDLLWLFAARPELDLEQLLELGREIDGGVTAENAMLVLAGTAPRLSACGFATLESAEIAFDKISALRERLVEGLDKLAERQAAPTLGKLLRAL